MTTPRSLGDKPIRDLPALLSFVNQLWLPDYRLLRRKLGAMLSKPSPFAVPLWDGEAWHSAQFGTLGTDLPDANVTIEIADGNIRVARADTLTADRTVNPGVAAAQGDSFLIVNFSSTWTLNVVTSTAPILVAPSFVGIVRVDAGSWVSGGRHPLTLDPETF